MCGLLWIFFSDSLAASIAPSREALIDIQNLKGFFYIGATAILLYLFIRWELLRAIRAELKANEARAELAVVNQQLEARVEDRTRDLVDTNNELRRFSHTLSHDLRAPLRAMSGYAFALSEDHADKLDAEGQEYVAGIRTSVKRADEMITGLMGLAQVLQAQLKISKVNISKLASEVSDDLKRRNPERKVEISIENEINVYADPLLIRTIIENLVRNAWKYTSRRDGGSIWVTSAPNGFTVRDNGIGFDPAFAEDLFDEFKRMPEAQAFPGMGIGLSTVRRIVDRHHGQIEAKGELGRGASFTITFPAHIPESATEQDQDSAQAPDVR